ncbi:MAG: HAD family hydrolase [Oscillospiraceae bacterium]|nr:HAD family hydrolase [Oscillospiraceae bacterium]
MTYRMILTDLDHTLLHNDGSVSERTLSVLRAAQDKGVYVAAATARYYIGAEKYIDMIQPDFVINTDGALIHRRGEEIFSESFTAEQTNTLIGALLEHDAKAEITCAAGKAVFWNDAEHIAASERLRKAQYIDFTQPFEIRANKIATLLDSDTTAQRIADTVGCKVQGYRGEHWYSFMPRTAGKTAAITALSAITGITLSEMVSFGDDSNDTEMLRLCGRGVAVANAVDEARAAADEVTASNDDDGVAVWIEKNIL